VVVVSLVVIQAPAFEDFLESWLHCFLFLGRRPSLLYIQGGSIPVPPGAWACSCVPFLSRSAGLLKPLLPAHMSLPLATSLPGRGHGGTYAEGREQLYAQIRSKKDSEVSLAP
jgi:hypothetical protein